jgi:hypothetical protein
VERLVFYLAVSLLKESLHEERNMQSEDTGLSEFIAAYDLFQACIPQESCHSYLTLLIFFKVAALKRQQDVIAA